MNTKIIPFGRRRVSNVVQYRANNLERVGINNNSQESA